MQKKTSSEHFAQYGSVYDISMNGKAGYIGRDWQISARRNIYNLYHFECDVFIEVKDGMGCLLVGLEPDSSNLEEFSIHRFIRLKAGVYFDVVAVTSSLSYRMIMPIDFKYKVVSLPASYFFKRVLPRIRILEIHGYYYNIRSSGYHFKGEEHGFFELTFVDRGCLITEIEGKKYELFENELILYAPNQFHTQYVPDDNSCSYVTIIFSMDIEHTYENPQDYNSILNRKFNYDKKIHSLIKTFVQESDSVLPYTNSLMICILQEIVIRLLQNSFVGKIPEMPTFGIRHNYQDELLERVISFIDENICEPLTIAELCQKFSMSRSSMQLLFKENINTTPKKYISDLKLSRSRDMILSGKYNVSEIALMMGFNSVHYFSRTFTQKYKIAPSEYSKKLLP